MTTTLTRRSAAPTVRPDAPPRRWPPGLTVAAGGFYLCMAGTHLALATGNPDAYGGMADTMSYDVLRRLWDDVFMAHPTAWGLVAFGLEVLLGTLLLLGGRPAKVGWVGIIAFQVAVLGFGWVYLAWTVPAVLVLVLAARHDWPLLERPAR